MAGMSPSNEAGNPADVSPLRPKFVEKTPPCISHCPNELDVRRWLTTIAQAEAYGRSGDQALELAWRTIADCNPFPAICGRVCPHPCEEACNRRSKEGPVNISALERFVGDFAIAKGLKFDSIGAERHSEKIAIIGSGPAGLSCAYQLIRRGYSVTVFEAFRRPGGMLRYGIPRYRLPREVLDAEIQRILDLGVDLRCSVMVGNDLSIEQLRRDYRAIFIGIGAHKGMKLGIPGEDAGNVLTGAEFLNRANSGEGIRIGRKVVVIGGGDTAIDSARMSRRLGADVTILYRRTRNDMPAIAHEIDGALEEGVSLELLAAPIEVLLKNGAAVALRCIRMKLGEPDSSGRPKPTPITGSEFEIEASTIIAAVSQEPDSGAFAGLRQDTSFIKADEWGTTEDTGIYAGGDDLALALVATAIYQGRMAAQAIVAHLRGEKPAKPESHPDTKNVIADWFPEIEPHKRPRIPVEQRDMETEIECTLSKEEALEEAKRCMSCGLCMDCESCWLYCANNCFIRLPKGEHYNIKMDLCNGCKKCAEGCPAGCLELF